METKTLQTRCCIAGGGPAGIMLGFLLAKEGIDVIVLEKWGDFLRDFRGDTIHPSTMEVLKELNLLEKFLALSHNETRQMSAHIGGKEFIAADFTHLKVTCPFIAFIPQSDFLNFISEEAKKYPGFHLMMETEAIDIIEENGQVAGLKAKHGSEEINIRAELAVGADGRHSAIRKKAGLRVEDRGAPIDVLWFSLSRKSNNDLQSLGYINSGKLFIMLNRNEYWQCGFVIKKGDFERIKSLGLDDFRNSIAELVPFLADTVQEIKNWDQVKTLSVAVDYLATWYRPGLLCIGDAAHAMSPIGGVGINLAIQDAVAAANILIPAFYKGKPPVEHLKKIQKRRAWPAYLTQRLQVFMHLHFVMQVLNNSGQVKFPWGLRLFQIFPILKRIPARAIGIGFLPEHIRFKKVIK